MTWNKTNNSIFFLQNCFCHIEIYFHNLSCQALSSPSSKKDGRGHTFSFGVQHAKSFECGECTSFCWFRSITPSYPQRKKHLWSCFQLGESLIHYRSPRCESLKTFRVHWFHMFRSMWFCCNLPWVPARWWCATFPGHRWWKKRHGFYTMPDVVWNVQKLLWRNSTMILLYELIWTRSSYIL